MIRQSNAGLVLDFEGEAGVSGIKNMFNDFFSSYLKYIKSFDPLKVNKVVFDKYSARSVTEVLANKLNGLVI